MQIHQIGDEPVADDHIQRAHDLHRAEQDGRDVPNGAVALAQAHAQVAKVLLRRDGVDGSRKRRFGVAR